MACIIKMESKVFLNKFCKEYDPNDFQIVLVSKDIETKNKFENVISATELFPAKEVLNSKINAGDFDYKTMYLEQMKSQMLLISTIVLSAAKYDNNVILLCSNVEDEFKYLDELGDFIENIFDIDVVTYKKITKKPKLLTKPMDEEVAEEIEKEISKIKKKISKNTNSSKSKNNDTLDEFELLVGDVGKKKLRKMFLEFSDIDKDELKEMSKKELKEMSIEFASNGTNKQIKKLIKFLAK